VRGASVQAGAFVALLRPFETFTSSFAAGFVLEVKAIYPDQGRVGGDFLSLALPCTEQRVLCGVRPNEVREVAGPGGEH
jgi:hypothetical protein